MALGATRNKQLPSGQNSEEMQLKEAEAAAKVKDKTRITFIVALEKVTESLWDVKRYL